MGETLFNTFSFDFIKKKKQADDDEPYEKPKKKKKKKKPEEIKAAEEEKEKEKELQPELQEAPPDEKIADGKSRFDGPLKARPSDLPDPNDPASNYFSDRNSKQPVNESGENGPTNNYIPKHNPPPASPIADEDFQFQFNRRYMYNSTGDLVSYE